MKRTAPDTRPLKYKRSRTSESQDDTSPQSLFQQWQMYVRVLYPDCENKTICVPPVILTRILYQKKTVSGEQAFVQREWQGYSVSAAKAGSSTHVSPASTPVPRSHLRRSDEDVNPALKEKTRHGRFEEGVVSGARPSPQRPALRADLGARPAEEGVFRGARQLQERPAFLGDLGARPSPQRPVLQADLGARPPEEGVFLGARPLQERPVFLGYPGAKPSTQRYARLGGSGRVTQHTSVPQPKEVSTQHILLSQSYQRVHDSRQVQTCHSYQRNQSSFYSQQTQEYHDSQQTQTFHGCHRIQAFCGSQPSASSQQRHAFDSALCTQLFQSYTGIWPGDVFSQRRFPTPYRYPAEPVQGIPNMHPTYVQQFEQPLVTRRADQQDYMPQEFDRVERPAFFPTLTVSNPQPPQYASHNPHHRDWQVQNPGFQRAAPPPYPPQRVQKEYPPHRPAQGHCGHPYQRHRPETEYRSRWPVHGHSGPFPRHRPPAHSPWAFYQQTPPCRPQRPFPMQRPMNVPQQWCAYESFSPQGPPELQDFYQYTPPPPDPSAIGSLRSPRGHFMATGASQTSSVGGTSTVWSSPSQTRPRHTGPSHSGRNKTKRRPKILQRQHTGTSHSLRSPSTTATVSHPKTGQPLSARDTPVSCSMWKRPCDPDCKLEPVYESDTREDIAQQHVLNCLEALGEANGEVMFVVSQLNFENYLNKPCYSAAVEMLKVPLPADLKDMTQKDFHRGDFDLLIIHRDRGIMVGEIKAIGLNTAVEPGKLKDRIKRAICQLDKSDKVVKHLLNDIVPELDVRKTLILPYVARADLQQLLQDDPTLAQELSACLGAQQDTDVTWLCLCSDDLSPRNKREDVNPTVLQKLQSWWKTRMLHSTKQWNPQLYMEIAARFEGPATTVSPQVAPPREETRCLFRCWEPLLKHDSFRNATTVSVHCVVPPRVEIRTLSDAVCEAGNRLARLVLTPRQVQLINDKKEKVCLSGPPGTGKTIVLVLKALDWLRRGHDVHIVSARLTSRAVSFQMRHQLKHSVNQQQQERDKHDAELVLSSPTRRQLAAGGLGSTTLDSQRTTIEKSQAGSSQSGRTAFEKARAASAGVGSTKVETERTTFGKVHLHFFDVYEKEDDIGRCASVLKEAARNAPDRRVYVISDEIHPSHRVAGPLFHKLFEELCRIQGIHLWVASVTNKDIPQCFDEEKLTVPLRSAPAVVKEVSPGIAEHPVYTYSTESVHGPCDGLAPKIFTHHGRNHSGTWPVECYQCGFDVATFLFSELKVGRDDQSCGSNIQTPQCLQYRDVFVLTRNLDLRDAGHDENGKEVPACGFVQGLRTGGMPVKVIRKAGVTTEEWEKQLEEMAEARHDQVIAAVWGSACGLERRIVVYLRGRASQFDDEKTDEYVDAQDRLYALSRCTTQLIVVERGRPDL